MGENFGSLAHRILKRRAKAIRAASRKDLEDPDRLHQLRIAAKRMRYAMEIFSGCFPVNFRRTHYRAVERLQDELGRINDLRNLLRTINGIGEKVKPVDPSANGEAMVSARDDLSTTVAAELRSQRIRFIRRWTRKSQRLFYQRLKAVLNRPVARTRIRGRAKSKL
jgi:CHAD domain-containing protein